MGKFKAKNLKMPVVQWDESMKVIMTNVGDCLFFAIGSSIYMRCSNEKGVKIVR